MFKRITNPSVILTLDTKGAGRKSGRNSSDNGVLEGFDIIIENDKIKDFIPSGSSLSFPHKKVDAKGRTVIPGFVESHTHALHLGDRSNEFKMKLEGKSYDEIAAAGGGIVSTMKAIRAASDSELLAAILKKIDLFIAQGVTTLEVKSGYGLDFESELKMLRIINKAGELRNINIVPCFLGAHTVPPEFKSNREGYIELIMNKLMPVVKTERLSSRCDAFCESSAFSTAEVKIIFEKAKELGFNLTLHTDQFNNIGGLELAVSMKALSADHLEVLRHDQIPKISSSDTVAVLLPGVSYTLDYNYAPARDLIDSGATVALATDYNPGTSNINSISLIMSLAARKMKMRFEEIISAYTINSAAALGVSNETGSLEPGKNADIAILNTANPNRLIYDTAQNLNGTTIRSGKIVYNKPN